MAFVIDLAGLADLIGDIEAFDRAVAGQVARLDGEMADLHGVWTGAAATSQQQAHQRLSEGLAWMREGLADMQRAGRIAHANYSGAVRSNTSMMDQVG